MVYNAMKLFMEINPQLFDECSHEYAESQNNADEKKQSRQIRWDKLAEQARRKKNGQIELTLPVTTDQGSKVNSPMRMDNIDPLSAESQRRFEALRIQDDNAVGRDRQRDYDSENSVR